MGVTMALLLETFVAGIIVSQYLTFKIKYYIK